MDCEDERAEWDIRNEFETINDMPVYYGGDLYDSDESEWEDSYNLVYAEYVDQYNFDALEGTELNVFERLQGPDESETIINIMTRDMCISHRQSVQYWRWIWGVRSRRQTLSL